jgi:hypothetical protein
VVEVVDPDLGGNVNRTKAWLFLIAFTVILILTIFEGVNDGFTVLNWIVIVVSAVFAAQSAMTLAGDGSSET